MANDDAASAGSLFALPIAVVKHARGGAGRSVPRAGTTARCGGLAGSAMCPATTAPQTGGIAILILPANSAVTSMLARTAN